ncbi:hypothetical protein [Nonomuraea sp. NPDC048826]|uniref:hypothetical protein n=1 Tax=Nonomuraea sp. NPDC048826 TaxID=3364347 RepID=UPI003715BEBF
MTDTHSIPVSRYVIISLLEVTPGAADDAVEVGRPAGSAPIEVVDSRPIGAVWLLEGLWRQLAVASAIKKTADGRRFTTNMEGVLFALVAKAIWKGRALLATEPVHPVSAGPGLE